MIIMDLSQVTRATLMAQTKGNLDNIDPNLLKHMMLNSIRANKVKFSREYGPLVIACDSGNNWRKKIFPYYKANRKTSVAGYDIFFEVLNNVIAGLDKFFPYTVVKVDTAEADDIIATLCHEYGKVLLNSTTEKILIVSGDKDFIQLQSYRNVKQYNPVKKSWVSHRDPERFLKEHIMIGDKVDGVPNFLSDADTFVTDKRQKPLGQKKIDVWVNQKPEDFCVDKYMLSRYNTNKKIIDLFEIPNELQEKIINVYNQQKEKSKGSIYTYLKANKMINLLQSINEF